MSVQVIAAASADEPARNHLSYTHPLYPVAARHCNRHGRTPGARPCGKCWELTIRDDERVVIECDLPREIEVDPTFIDEVAVRKACRGERVTLTRAERVEAMRRLAAQKVTRGAIANLLHIAVRDVDPSIPRSPRTRSGRSLNRLHCNRLAVTR